MFNTLVLITIMPEEENFRKKERENQKVKILRLCSFKWNVMKNYNKKKVLWRKKKVLENSE